MQSHRYPDWQTSKMQFPSPKLWTQVPAGMKSEHGHEVEVTTHLLSLVGETAEAVDVAMAATRKIPVSVSSLTHVGGGKKFGRLR